MNRAEKAERINHLVERLADAPYVALADFRGINVAEISQLRRAFEAQGVFYEVVKNTLAVRAIEGTSKEGLGQFLTGMTGWIVSGDDPIATAKLIREATKDFKKKQIFTIKGGWFDGSTLGEAAIQKVADLPSREEMLSQLLATMQEAPRQILGVMQGPARDLLYLLKNYENKLDEDQAL